MKNKYTYRIRKRQPYETLDGYGFELIIYKNGKVIDKSGAYGGITQAKEWWATYITNEIEEFGFFELKSITLEK